jgi:hypothetical protein
VRTKLSLRPESGYLLAPVYSYGYRLEHLKLSETLETAGEGVTSSIGMVPLTSN